MIIERKEESSIVKGDFQKKEVTVSAKSLDKMIYLLSNGAYKHPRHSTVREIVSNAIDAEVEIGINPVETPVILTLDSKILSVRDYGVGIDDERMDIIQDLGASTKENRNDLIGAMGIGFFAPLSYTPQFTCDSFVNGTKRSWLIQKSAGKINILKLGEEKSEEKNGTLIIIPITDDLYEWEVAIRETLSYFKGVYIDHSRLSDMNTSKIYEGESFIINETLPIGSFHIVLDQVVYPLSYRDFDLPGDIQIGFKFRLDEGIVPLPNREAIIIDEITKTKIINRVKEGITEMMKYTKEYTNAFSYYHKDQHLTTFVFNGEPLGLYSFRSFVKKFGLEKVFEKHQVKVNNKYWTDEYLLAIKNCIRPLYYRNHNGVVKSWDRYSPVPNKFNKFIVLDIPWTKKTSSFIKENGSNVVEIKKPNSLSNYFYQTLRLKYIPRAEWRNVVESFFKDLEIIESCYPKMSDFKDEINKVVRKKQTKRVKREREDVILHTPFGGGKGKYLFTMGSKSYSLEDLPKKGLYIYSDSRGDLDVLYQLEKNNKNVYPCYMINRDIQKIEEIKPKNFISLKDFTSGSHRLSKKWITYTIIKEEMSRYQWALVRKTYYQKNDQTKLDQTWLGKSQVNISLNRILKVLDEMNTLALHQEPLLKSLVDTYVKAGFIDYAVYREWEYVKRELDKLTVLKQIDSSITQDKMFFNHFVTYKKSRDFYKKQFLNLKKCK